MEIPLVVDEQEYQFGELVKGKIMAQPFKSSSIKYLFKKNIQIMSFIDKNLSIMKYTI
jgi:hypothetical protein